MSWSSDAPVVGAASSGSFSYLVLTRGTHVIFVQVLSYSFLISFQWSLWGSFLSCSFFWKWRFFRPHSLHFLWWHCPKHHCFVILRYFAGWGRQRQSLLCILMGRLIRDSGHFRCHPFNPPHHLCQCRCSSTHHYQRHWLRASSCNCASWFQCGYSAPGGATHWWIIVVTGVGWSFGGWGVGLRWVSYSNRSLENFM